MEPLSLCDDITAPYRVGVRGDFGWFTPGELRMFKRNGYGLLVRIMHPLDEEYPYHRYVGGKNAVNLKPGQIPGHKEPAKQIYTWVAYQEVKSGRYSGHMNLPRYVFAHLSWCGECGERFEGQDYLCEGCRDVRSPNGTD